MYQPIQHKNTTTPIVRNSINCARLRHRLVLIALALFSFLAVCPTITCGQCVEDTDGQIPFTVMVKHRLLHQRFFVSQVVGWRESNLVFLDHLGLQPCTFYRIRKTIFSHTGTWKAVLDDIDDSGVGARLVRFKVNKDTNRVDITIDNTIIKVAVNGVESVEASAETAAEGVNTLQQSQAPSPTQLSVEAWLGDSQDPSGRPDSDRWFFLGNAGDSVIVRVEPDNKGGNNGGHATLRFIGPPTKQVSGELPMRIDVDQLGSTGRYDIEIEQAAGQGEEHYRGGYTLTIESAQGTIHGLTPGDSVEK